MKTHDSDLHRYAGPWAAVPKILSRIQAPTFPDRDFDGVTFNGQGVAPAMSDASLF